MASDISGSDRFTRGFLLLEGAAMFAISVTIYFMAGYDWIVFAVLFFTPDLSMLGYLRGPKLGAWCYNIAHTYVTAIVIAVVGETMGIAEVLPFAIILFAHISFDRMLGYGLKSRQGFHVTHLGFIGKAAKMAKAEADVSPAQL